MDEEAKPAPDATPTTIDYHNLPSRHFRVLHADGAFGGPTPNGRQIQFVFYSERPSIPSVVRHALTPVKQGLSVGGEIIDARISKGGIEREMEADVRMDLDAARNFHRWLGRHLDSIAAASATAATELEADDAEAGDDR